MTPAETKRLELKQRAQRANAAQKPPTTSSGPGSRIAYDAHMKARSESAIEIRDRLEATLLEYERAALSRHQFEAATAYATAASLVRGTCVQLSQPLSSEDDSL